MKSQISCLLPQKCARLNYSPNSSEGRADEQLVLRQFDFPNSDRKNRFDLLTVPSEGAFRSGAQSSRKQMDETIQNVTFKDTLPCRFTASDTKNRASCQVSTAKSELVREYELALDQIESALAAKNFELSKTLRQMSIQLEQKERYIEETTASYEQQIETIESAYLKATQKLMELQSTCKNQAIRLVECELKLESQKDIIRKLTEKSESTHFMQEQNLEAFGKSVQDLAELLEKQKQKNKNLAEKLQTSGADCQELTKLRQEADLLRNSLASKESQCSKFIELSGKLELELKKAQRDITELSETQVVYRQSERVLAETHLIGNLMLKELNQTKQKLNHLTKQSAENKKLIDQQTQQLTSLKFENQTLSEYNKVLIDKLNNGIHERTKQTKWTKNIPSTLCYSGAK